MRLGREEVTTIQRKIWPYLLAGITLGAAIHGWVPEAFFLRYAGPDNPFVPLSPSPSAYRCTSTPPASCRWSKRYTPRAWRWAPCWR
jgi:hypothetical protein